MFYQQQPDMQAYFRMYEKHWHKIGTHIHNFFELHCCTADQLWLTIDGKEYALKAGEAALIFPYQPHSFREKAGEGFFFTFEPALIASFASAYANRLPKDPVFPFSFDFSALSEESNIFAIKSFLYAMCSHASQLEYVELSADNRQLLAKICQTTEMRFVEEGFSLEQLAKSLGYDYGYISKYFLQKTGLRYSMYLNQRRIDHAVALMRKSMGGNISDLAFACGYGSVRSFNRNFSLLKGCTPSEYMKKP